MSSRKPSATILECGHCGAPLEIGSDTRIARCAYCGTKSQINAMRTVSVTVPPGWVPPPVWTPPESAPADSHRALRYQKQVGRAILAVVLSSVLFVVLGIVVAIATHGRKVTRQVQWTVRQAGGGPAPVPVPRLPASRLTPISLARTQPELARALGATETGTRLRLELAGDAFTAVAFEWRPELPDHVRQFNLTVSGAHPQYAKVRARLEQALPRRWYGDHWRWEGVSLYYAPRGGVLGVHLTSTPGRTDRERPIWKQQIALLWDIVRAAALDLPVKVDTAAVREYLGGGHPLTTLAKLAFDVDVDQAAAEVTRVFPGASIRQLGGLDLTLALDHPWLGQADLSWPNEKGGRLRSVHLRPAAGTNRLEHQDDLIACVRQGFGLKGREYVTDHLARKRDVSFALKEGGSVRVYDHLVAISPRDGFRGRFMSRAGWEKLLGVLDACGRPPR